MNSPARWELMYFSFGDRTVKSLIKKPSLLGLVMGTPIVIAIIMIVLVAVFIWFYVTLAVLGLLTAAIFS
jgi:hypothetical protein